jgi:hypothetical protein
VDPVPDPLLFFLLVPGIEPRTALVVDGSFIIFDAFSREFHFCLMARLWTKSSAIKCD